MQKLRLGFMAQLTTKNVLDDIDFAVDNEFTAFEIDLGWSQNFDLKEKVVKQIKERSESTDLFLITHTPWYLPTCSVIPEIQDAVFKVISKGILFAEKVNSDRITVHPGFREMPGPALDKNYDALINILKKIVKFGEEHNVKVGLENLDKNDYCMCFEAQDLLRAVECVDGLNITLDVGHAFTTGLPIDYYKKVKSFVIDVHVHDNDGKTDQHKCIGEGKIDFKTLLKEFKSNNYHGPFILELFPHTNILRGKERFLNFWLNNIKLKSSFS